MDVLVTYLIKEKDKPNRCFRFYLKEVESKTLDGLMAKEGIFDYQILKREIDLNSDEEEV